MKRAARGLMIGGGVLVTCFVAVAAQYLIRGAPSDAEAPEKRVILAHRGVHLNYRPGTYDPVSGCEAAHIYPPAHRYIENTIEAIGAAFAAGADIVEVDIRRTADGQLVLMHDFRLDCRTNGTGLVKERDLAYLKTLDMGYGYTADGGESFPLRGSGVGKIATFGELLAAFPDRSFLIDHKDGDAESTRILIDTLRPVPQEQRGRLRYWGPTSALEAIRRQYPEIRRLLMQRFQVSRALAPFFLTFGLAHVPPEYRGLTITIPPQYMRWVWGWPYRFISRLHEEGLKLFLYVDSIEDARRSRNLPVDGFITDYVEVTGPVLAAAAKSAER